VPADEPLVVGDTLDDGMLDGADVAHHAVL
jgi:hypothetical protein